MSEQKMEHLDPDKRIRAVAVTLHEGWPRILLLLDGDSAIVADHDPLTESEADIFGHGVRAGLLWADLERMKLEGEMAVIEPDDAAPNAELFREGMAEGLRIAADGYWLDEEHQSAMVH